MIGSFYYMIYHFVIINNFDQSVLAVKGSLTAGD